jgi:hypothetical protein
VHCNQKVAPVTRFPFRLRIWRAVGVLLFGGVALLCGSVASGQEPLTAEAIEHMARVLTDRNPKVKSAELWGCIRFPGLANDRLRFLYRYAAPDEYLLLLALDEENATFLASDAKGTVIYDPRRGHVLVVSDVIPTFYMGLQANALEFKWGFVGKSPRPSTESATEPADKLILDIPSLLRNRNVVRH